MYKAEQNRCRELGALPKFRSKNFLKIQEYPNVNDFEGKKRLHGRCSNNAIYCEVVYYS